MKSIFALLLCLLAATVPLRAHDPFDASLRVLVRESDLEATVTLGLDAAKEVLAHAGLSREQVADFVRHRGPHAEIGLPLHTAAKCLEISRDGKPLPPTQAKLLSEGMEIVLTFLYPRPAAGPLQVRAVCYEEVAQMRDGSFVATNEAADQLGAALLTRTAPSTEMTLPAPSAR